MVIIALKIIPSNVGKNNFLKRTGIDPLPYSRPLSTVLSFITIILYIQIYIKKDRTDVYSGAP
ncbi:MAG: hypothetical protein K2M65_07320, partial [Muribaculaceae bacterium]|nr:hypothetical protein [Muribaculaceae bacterium]